MILNKYFPVVGQDGAIRKPRPCSFCALGAEGIKAKGVGFVPDGLVAVPKITDSDIGRIRLVVLCEQPAKDEANNMCPMTGPYGTVRWKRFFEKTGWQRDEVGFTFLRRCYTPLYQGRYQATPAALVDGAKKCRAHDDLLTAFRPDTALITNAFEDSREEAAYYRLTLADISKARGLTDKGKRVILLMGTGPVKHYLPSLSGGLKNWAGSWFSL
jgi:hypothetical protein